MAGLSTGDDGRVWSDREVQVLLASVRAEVGKRTVDLSESGLGELLGLDVAARFVGGLDAVVARGLRQPRSSLGAVDARGVTRMGNGGLRTSSGHLATRRQGARGVGPGARGSGDGVIRDEAALAMVDRVRRQIRKLCREMEELLDERTSAVGGSRCSGCGRWVETGWKWCPWDGRAVS